MEDNSFTFNFEMISRHMHIRRIADILLFLSVFCTLDFTIGKLLLKLYFSTKTGVYYEATNVIEHVRSEVLILGSSRACHHYIPQLFEDKLGLSCYNCGRDGNNLLYNTAIFKTIVNRYKPQLIILDISPSELYYNQKSYDELSSLFPYYFSHEELQEIVNKKGPFERFKLTSTVFQFNSTIITSLANQESNSTNGNNKGYVPLPGSATKPEVERRDCNSIYQVIDENKIQALSSIATTCKNFGIRLIVVISPRYANLSYINLERKTQEVLENTRTPFLSYLHDSTFTKHPELFKDNAHLNSSGAQLFSNFIVNWLMDNSNGTLPKH